MLFYFSVSFPLSFSFAGKPFIIFYKPSLFNKSCHSSFITIFSSGAQDFPVFRTRPLYLASVPWEIVLSPLSTSPPASLSLINPCSAGFLPIPPAETLSISSHQHGIGPGAEQPSSRPSERSCASVYTSCGGRLLVHLWSVALLSQNHFLHLCFLFCFQKVSSLPTYKSMYSLFIHWLHN